MKTTKLLLVAMVLFVLLAGCAQQEKFEPVEKVCAGGLDKAQALQTAEAVLVKMHFKIDKADVEQGFIRTHGLTGAQFFEFWRKDSAGEFNRAEANLHNIRRIVQVDVTGQGSDVCLGCIVKTQRLSLSEVAKDDEGDEVTVTDRFAPQISHDPDLRLGERKQAWVDLGRDTRLETKILKQIKEKL
ncbi:hypothetical protein ACFL3G_04260 [Planctomycetota bacterium]